jgi:hypothetical protein
MELLGSLVNAAIGFLVVTLLVLLYGAFFALYPRDGGSRTSRELIASLQQKVKSGTIDPVDAFLLKANRLYVGLHENYFRVAGAIATALTGLFILKMVIG